MFGRPSTLRTTSTITEGEEVSRDAAETDSVWPDEVPCIVGLDGERAIGATLRLKSYVWYTIPAFNR